MQTMLVDRYLLSVSAWMMRLVGHLSPFTFLVFVSISANFGLSFMGKHDVRSSFSVSRNRQSEKLGGLCQLAGHEADTPPALPIGALEGKNLTSLAIASSEVDSCALTKTVKLSGQGSSFFAFTENERVPSVSAHYVCPPITVESLRQRYGKRKTVWGEWSPAQTRWFYKTQLPWALQIDGALGLSLEERAKMASQARHALRLYSRERCHLPARVVARLYDGLRHWHDFGSWSPEGMSWVEIKGKYTEEARRTLGLTATKEEVELFVYRRIIDKACSTNKFFDDLAQKGEFRSISSVLKKGFQSFDGSGGDSYSGRRSILPSPYKNYFIIYKHSKRRKQSIVVDKYANSLRFVVSPIFRGLHNGWSGLGTHVDFPLPCCCFDNLIMMTLSFTQTLLI